MQEEMDQNASPNRLLDAVVLGGGQAGLAIAWHLKHQGLRFVVLEAGSDLGHTWRDRWDSLKLFTPAQYDGLPGMPFPAPADTYPTKDPVADYLQTYVTAFHLPVRLNTRVTRLTRQTRDSRSAPATRRSTPGRWSWPPGPSRFPSSRRPHKG